MQDAAHTPEAIQARAKQLSKLRRYPTTRQRRNYTKKMLMLEFPELTAHEAAKYATAAHATTPRTIAEVVTGFGEWKHPVKIVGALCEDGQRRTVRLALQADSAFSWGGRCTIKGKTVTGYCVTEAVNPDQENSATDWLFKTYKPEPLKAGIYADSAHGYEHNGAVVQELAKLHGWRGRKLSSKNEWFNEAVTEAEDFLAGIAPAGTWAGFYEGSFGIWPIRYKENQFRYIINLDERGEFSASLYRIDPETGQDEPESYADILTEEAHEMSQDGVNVHDGAAVLMHIFRMRNELTGRNYTVLEQDEEAQEDND